MSYRYFMASLPPLVAGGSVPISLKEFVSLLTAHLDFAALNMLLRSTLFDAHRDMLLAAIESEYYMEAVEERADAYAIAETDIPAAQRWLLFDYGLRGEMARMRAAAQKGDADAHWPTLDSLTYIEELRRLFRQHNPMKIEMGIYEIRWKFLDELAADARHELDEIVWYYLRLTLLTRMSVMQEERGLAALDAIYHVCSERLEKELEEFYPSKAEYG